MTLNDIQVTKKLRMNYRTVSLMPYMRHFFPNAVECTVVRDLRDIIIIIIIIIILTYAFVSPSLCQQGYFKKLCFVYEFLLIFGRGVAFETRK